MGLHFRGLYNIWQEGMSSVWYVTIFFKLLWNFTYKSNQSSGNWSQNLIILILYPTQHTPCWSILHVWSISIPLPLKLQLSLWLTFDFNLLRNKTLCSLSLNLWFLLMKIDWLLDSCRSTTFINPGYL